ncbi:MAG TPA: ATP-binding protein [Candidatus Blautia intestinavium]|nr:ATP-binding protein [Candidatus Blautia intestinavium]
MALQNFQYDIIMREYSRRQAQVRRELEQRRQDAFRKVPRLAEIDREVASLSAQRARSLLQNGTGSVADLKKEVAVLADERLALLRGNGFPDDYLEPRYICPHCQDTGYVGSRKCSCFKKAEIELLYTQSNIREILEKENFEHFSFDWYSDTIKNEATGLSARETARRAYDAAWNFVRDFDARFQNLFLYGSTGVGKTFLSHCIAHELLKTAHCVLYFSAYDLFDRLAHTAFSRKSENDADEDFIYDCDLLIIDDLGTELTNSFVSSELFFCINERLTRRKSTVISTNLKLEDFSATYSERTFSRIASNFQMLKLIGKDIRIQKIFLGGK